MIIMGLKINRKKTANEYRLKMASFIRVPQRNEARRRESIWEVTNGKNGNDKLKIENQEDNKEDCVRIISLIPDRERRAARKKERRCRGACLCYIGSFVSLCIKSQNVPSPLSMFS